MPRTASSRSADGATTAALLPPSSRIRRPKREATTGATARPMRVEPVADTMATPSCAASAAPDVGPALEHLVEPVRGADVGGGPAQQGVAGHGRQRRLVRRLPQHRVAGDEGQGGVPRPHGDGEVERRDHGARAHRVPRLHQAVAGPLAGDRQAVQLAGQPDGEVADVDHLLDLAEALASGSCPPRSRPARRARPCARAAARRAGARGCRGSAPGWPATCGTRPWLAATAASTSAGAPAGPSEPPVIGERAVRSPDGASAPHSARIAATRVASSAVVGSAVTPYRPERPGPRSRWPAPRRPGPG